MTSVSVAMMGERPALTLAGFGLISGILSATLGFMFEPEWLEPIANLFWLESGMVPIGAFYGICLGLGIALCTKRRWAAPLTLLAIMIAWSAAIHTAIAIVKLGDGAPDAPRNLLAGVAAGAIGAALTHLGVMPVAAGTRRLMGIGLTTAVGALCGALYCLEEMHVIPSRTLYVIWQPAVAFCIGLAMAGAPAGLEATATSAPRRS
jgi:hypothetical protein